MKLLPIRFALVFGSLRVIDATLLELDSDERPEMVSNDTLFGFQVASEEVVDDLELDLAEEESGYATPQASYRR